MARLLRFATIAVEPRGGAATLQLRRESGGTAVPLGQAEFDRVLVKGSKALRDAAKRAAQSGVPKAKRPLSKGRPTMKDAGARRSACPSHAFAVSRLADAKMLDVAQKVLAR
ncbi:MULTISPECIES: hypothetical protein [unclassified Variovorax]|uniref:hypothetical protein n=1 Tax=unclassified Variovorax TaxID=663243 RepID=UPI00116044A8